MIKMEKLDVKCLDNDALKTLYTEVCARTQSQLATDEKFNFDDISYLYSIENEARMRGLVIKEGGIQSKKRIKDTSREERTMRRIDRTLHDIDLKKANRTKFTRWMVMGIFLFLAGLILTMTSEGNYVYHGAILTGIGFFIVGVYGLATEK
jgi:hypothetical protein